METSFFLTARGLIKSLFKEPARRNPPIPVLGERGVIPRIRVQIQPHKPVEGQTPVSTRTKAHSEVTLADTCLEVPERAV